ncbi:hypothetical protein DSO57_1031277 [Entomophthora muscae]|uniref:Uncharacterized protein n=1 Tax=Entomophthora muscae TaxID=34485 RepID=A0ACC2RFF5_9FUNG|nr:hypothetical protein DSO57_1031277 [Entomophthora muscae]
MKEIPTAPPLPNVPPAQDFTTAVNYLVRIAPIVYMAFQAQPAFSVGVQLDSGMGCDTYHDYRNQGFNISHEILSP